MNRFILSLAASACALSAAAQAQNAAFTFKGGTTGLSLEGRYRVAEQFVIRANGNWLEFEADEETVSDVVYDSELSFSTLGGFVDWHPGGGSFFLSAGAFFGDKTVELSATPGVNVTVGELVFTPEQAGRLEGEGDFGDMAPYVGLGYSNAFTNSGGWAFTAEAGVMLLDDPSVSLVSVDGTFSDDPILRAELDREEEELEDEIDDLSVYPVVNVGLTYSF